MLDIDISTIPHREQRCGGNTGDYWESHDGKKLHVRVSEMDDWRSEVLLAIHELVEYYLCRAKGIKEPEIQSFDEEYYRQEKLGVKSGYETAGEDPKAPYHEQHMTAELVERVVAGEMGMSWKEHNSNQDRAMEEKLVRPTDI